MNNVGKWFPFRIDSVILNSESCILTDFRMENERIGDNCVEKRKKVFLKGNTLTEKWQYFKDYYMKAAILILVVISMLLILIKDIYRGTRESIFYALVVNSYTSVPDEFRDGFVAYAGLDDETYNVIIDSTMKINVEMLDDMTRNYMQEVIAISSTKKQDIFLADQQVIDYYWDAEYIVDIREYLPEEVWSAYEEQFYYREDKEGNQVPAGIIVADSPKLAEFGMYEYQNPILSVVYMAPDAENIAAFLSYLYDKKDIE